MLLKELHETHKEIIIITLEQVKNMAGNILRGNSKDVKTKIIISESAYNSFTHEQRNTLTKYVDLIPVNIKNIETNCRRW
ncbi:MAG: arginine deiminase-related protein [Arsenophonus sp. NEOnobi-MAG3]